MSEIWIQPTGGALAADVHGVDLSKPLSDATFGRTDFCRQGSEFVLLVRGHVDLEGGAQMDARLGNETGRELLA